jgi:hypothetical protein
MVRRHQSVATRLSLHTRGPVMTTISHPICWPIIIGTVVFAPFAAVPCNLHLDQFRN